MLGRCYRRRRRDRSSSREWDHDLYDGGSHHNRSVPTPTLYLRGIPDAANEIVLGALLAKYPNVREVRLVRDRATGEEGREGRA